MDRFGAPFGGEGLAWVAGRGERRNYGTRNLIMIVYDILSGAPAYFKEWYHIYPVAELSNAHL